MKSSSRRPAGSPRAGSPLPAETLVLVDVDGSTTTIGIDGSEVFRPKSGIPNLWPPICIDAGTARCTLYGKEPP